MAVLDRERFKKRIVLAGAKVLPNMIGSFRQACSRDVLKQPRLRSIYDHPKGKVIALRPEISPESIKPLVSMIE